MANGGTHVKNRFDLFPFEDLVFARAATDDRVVLAPGLQHRPAPPVTGRIAAGAARSMPPAASLVKPGDKPGNGAVAKPRS
jgi:hypothetical protein